MGGVGCVSVFLFCFALFFVVVFVCFFVCLHVFPTDLFYISKFLT